jgi:hypothetical protein
LAGEGVAVRSHSTDVSGDHISATVTSLRRFHGTEGFFMCEPARRMTELSLARHGTECPLHEVSMQRHVGEGSPPVEVGLYQFLKSNNVNDKQNL